MTERSATGENFDGLHERILRFVGAFSATQSVLDWSIERCLEVRLPHLGPRLHRVFRMDRASDDDRVALFRTLATEIEYGGDLQHYGTIWRRAAQARNLVAHGAAVTGPTHRPGQPPSVSVASFIHQKRDRLPDPLLPSTFDKLTADCGWLSAHVHRVLFEGSLAEFRTLTGEAAAEPDVVAATPPHGLTLD